MASGDHGFTTVERFWVLCHRDDRRYYPRRDDARDPLRAMRFPAKAEAVAESRGNGCEFDIVQVAIVVEPPEQVEPEDPHLARDRARLAEIDVEMERLHEERAELAAGLVES